MKKHLAGVILSSIGLAIVGAGCQDGGGGAGGGGATTRAVAYKNVGVPQPKDAPPAPPKGDVAVDPTLMATARQCVSQSLRSSDPLLRSQAVEALRNSPDAQATSQILAALDDRDRGVRFGAAMMAGELQLKQAYPKLKRLAQDPDGSVDVAALFALHKLGDTSRSQEIGQAALSEDKVVRRNVALVLGMLGEPSAIKILNRLRVDDDALVRQQAVEAMWRLGDQDAIKPLVALTASKYADDKIIGLLALAAPRRQIIREHVRGSLAGDAVQLEVSLVAARAMGMLGSDEGYAIAKDAIASKDPQQRFLAALALGSIGRTDAQDELKQLLSDPVPNVQLAAATALLQIQQGQGHQPQNLSSAR
jgi:HEAT repeat protein